MKIINKINDFFVEWFWWRWRSIWLNKQTDKDRKNICSILSKYSKENHIYVGWGTTVKILRNSDLKGQDLDILISRKFYTSKNFINMIEELGASKWHTYNHNNRIIIEKFLYKKRTPLEFFIADKNKREVTIHPHDREVWERNIPWQNVEVISYKGIKIPVPSNIEKYVVDVYGEKWNIPISTRKYDFKKDSNTNTLKRIS